MNSRNRILLIPFLALLLIVTAIGVIAAEDDSEDKPDNKETFVCYETRPNTDVWECTCIRGEGTCGDMLEICDGKVFDCNPEICFCPPDKDKLRETGSRFDKLKSKIEPQSPVYENAPTAPVMHDHRSSKIDANSNNQENVIGPNNRTGTVRVQRTRPGSSPTGNAPAPIVTDHR